MPGSLPSRYCCRHEKAFSARLRWSASWACWSRDALKCGGSFGMKGRSWRLLPIPETDAAPGTLAVVGILLAEEPSRENTTGSAGIDRIKANTCTQHLPFMLADPGNPGIALLILG